MQLTKETSLTLYHYCTSIADALRPFLNTDPIPEAEPTYWIPKLTEFEGVIASILDAPKQEKDFLEDIFGKDGSNQLFELMKSIRKDQFYETILSKNLQTLLHASYSFSSGMLPSECIETAIQITNEVIAKLEEQKK